VKIDLTDEDPPPGPSSRLSAAFWLQYNVILLFGVIGFSLALASPLPAAIGAGAEFLWLLAALAFPAIWRWIEQHNRMADAAAEERSDRQRDLDTRYRARASTLRLATDRIREACRRNTGVSRSELRSIMNRLEAIRETFLRFAGIHQRLSRFLEGVQAAQVDADVARINEELSVEKDPMVKVGLRQALVLSRRRLLQRDQVSNTLRAIAVQMSTIEAASAYLESTAANARLGRDIESEIDALAAQISPADLLEVEVGNVLAAATVAPPSMRPVAG